MSTNNKIMFWLEKKNTFLGPFVQSNVNLTSLLTTNALSVVAKVVSNTLIFLLQKCE